MWTLSTQRAQGALFNKDGFPQSVQITYRLRSRATINRWRNYIVLKCIKEKLNLIHLHTSIDNIKFNFDNSTEEVILKQGWYLLDHRDACGEFWRKMFLHSWLKFDIYIYLIWTNENCITSLWLYVSHIVLLTHCLCPTLLIGTWSTLLYLNLYEKKNNHSNSQPVSPTTAELWAVPTSAEHRCDKVISHVPCGKGFFPRPENSHWVHISELQTSTTLKMLP